MNDNLPDINFKEKKEKKGGAVGWFKNKLGFGSRGAIGEAGINPAAMNAGRAAFGAGKFGASSAGGLAGLLAGKGGIIATVAMVAVAGGVYLANNAPAPGTSTAAFSSGRTSDNYIPAILRSQAANNGSSLDMFKETNKGAGLAMETDPNKAQGAPKTSAAENAAGAADGQSADPNAAQPEQANMAGDMMAKLQGGNMGSLTSQLGGGSSKFSGMGGFNNKFGQGATGAKTGFSSGIGSGFSSMPKFDSRKNKMLAMKGSARPVFGGAKSGKSGKIAPGAFGQAKGMRAIQQSYSGASIDGARSTQDKAWEGTTGEGAVSGGGAGLSDGGAGIVTSPSLDNSGSGGGGGGAGTPQEPTVPDAPAPTNVSPWAGVLNQIAMLLMLAAVLSALGSMLIKVANSMSTAVVAGVIAQALRIAGYIMAGLAMAIGAYVIYLAATEVMGKYGQTFLGSVYMIGGVTAIVAGGMAMAGAFGMVAMFNPMWMSAATAAISLIGGMLGGK